MQEIGKREFRNVVLKSLESKMDIPVGSSNSLYAKSVEVGINFNC